MSLPPMTVQVPVYEVSGVERKNGEEYPPLLVRAHAIDIDSVVLIWGGKEITVDTSDLFQAIRSCSR